MVTGETAQSQTEESVYNLIPRVEVSVPKPPRYTSKFNRTVREIFKDGKYAHRTMGYAEEPIPNPQDFLKKHKKDTQPNVSSTDQKKTSQKKIISKAKSPVPNIRDAPKMGARTKKNFVQTNALDVVMTVPRKPAQNLVDDRHGDKYSLISSGLAPNYILKKNFGEVPVYIKSRHKEMEKANQEYQTYVSDYFRRGAMREMDDSERQTILDGLKNQWEDVHRDYQTLSVIIDTVPKKIYKESLEYKMKMLEKDIDLLEKHQVIYIAD